MRIPTGLVLPVFIAAATAASDGQVYLFSNDDLPNTPTPPILTPEQARLVFAQRLEISQYHSLSDSSATTLSYINTLGGRQRTLFEEANDKATEFVMVIDGVSPKTAGPLLEEWSSIKPAFSISSPPSMSENQKLVRDLSRQIGSHASCLLEEAIVTLSSDYYYGGHNIVYINLEERSTEIIKEISYAYSRLIRLTKEGSMNLLVVLMPESSRKSKLSYGSYEMPLSAQVEKRRVEEPMGDLSLTSPASLLTSKQSTASNSSSNSTRPITGVPKLCHSSLDSCTNATNSCSGHGQCYKKRGEKGKDACFTCGCTARKETFIHGSKNRTGIRITYWGGAACQKKDVSGPFWLFAIFTVVLVGLVSWAIGLMFSIGEEKLPGVIGAGVSTNKAR